MFNFTLDSKSKTQIEKLESIYDLVIIGAGPGGFNAALYAQRKGIKTVLIAKELGGQLTSTSLIENYLGINSVSGDDLTNIFVDHVNNFEVPILTGQNVSNLKKVDNLFYIEIEDGQITKSKAVIIATGANPRKLNIFGEQNLIGRGISYCAICDGPFYKDKEVVVIGGGNSAVEAAIDLAKIAKKVTVIELQKSFNADKILVDQLNSFENVKTIVFSQSNKFISQDDTLTALEYTNLSTNKKHTLNIEGAFIEIGVIPNNNIVKDLVELNKFGEIIVNVNQETSLKGLYAVGDVTNFPYKQIVTAASQGAVAALSVNNYINTEEK